MHRRPLILSCLAVLSLAVSGCGGEQAAGPEAEIAFVTSRDGDYAIYGMRADGSGEGRLTTDDRGDQTRPLKTFFQIQPAWSPDGTKIAFASQRDGRSHIFVMHANGSGTKRLTSGAHDDANPTWSPDGRWIAFERDQRLYVIRPKGTDLRRVTNTLEGEERDPAWSPDGSWLAYSFRKPGFTSREIWRVRPDGSGRLELTELNVNSGTPSWSPDGRRIAFSSNANDDRYQIYTIRVDGKGLRRLTFQPGEYFDPSWAPDGKTMALERDGVVYLRNAAGIEEPLTDGPNDGSPAWRPVLPAP